MGASTAEALLSLVLACAPAVHPDTAIRLIRAESGGQPWALGVNGGMVKPQPATLEQAAAAARLWVSWGYTVDLGYAQINSRTAQRLGLAIEEVLDPCENMKAMQLVLSENYTAAVKAHGPGQRALQAALSAYNTGNQTGGLRNGYVNRVYSQQAR